MDRLLELLLLEELEDEKDQLAAEGCHVGGDITAAAVESWIGSDRAVGLSDSDPIRRRNGGRKGRRG